MSDCLTESYPLVTISESYMKHPVFITATSLTGQWTSIRETALETVLSRRPRLLWPSLRELHASAQTSQSNSASPAPSGPESGEKECDSAGHDIWHRARRQ